LAAHALPFNRQGRAGQSNRAEGRKINALAAVGTPVAVALVFLDVGDVGMGCKNWLAALLARLRQARI